MKILTSKHYNSLILLVQVGPCALSLERNLPLYARRFGLRILRPFLNQGAGLHFGPWLVHLHTNRKPLYGQP